MSTSIEAWEQRISSADEAATMRAGVLFGVECVEVRDVPLPVIGEHDVLVRVSAVGLCGTDAHIFAGHANYNTDEYGQPIPFDVQPQILGHEISGRIEEIGSEVSATDVFGRLESNAWIGWLHRSGSVSRALPS